MKPPIKKLPSYKKPPVFEVAAGVQFETLEDFLAPHLGILWNCLGRKKFPACEEVINLVKHGETNPIQILQKPAFPRIWFKGKDETTLVQFQRDRFLYNWRKLNTNKPYPRYKKVITAFQEHYDAFTRCLSTLKLSPANIEMLELTYINIIPLDAFGGLQNIGRIFYDIKWSKKSSPGAPTKLNLLWQFDVPSNKSLLNIHIATAQNTESGEEVLRVELTVRGQAPDVKIEKCRKWFDQSREAIVTSFTNITTPEAHKLWERYE